MFVEDVLQDEECNSQHKLLPCLDGNLAAEGLINPYIIN